MEIRALQWDSDFFGLRIGRADIFTTEDALSLASQYNELKHQFDLLYVFDPNNVGFEANGARLVDEKILYSKPCEPRKQYPEISFYQAAQPNEDLYRLALVSGRYSRFKFDERFPKGSYERLYTRWIENACSKEGISKQILIFQDSQNAIKGMITVEHSGELGHIGLVAVDPDTQHQGVGSVIMSTLDGYLYQQGVKILEVPTQKSNTNACRWYEKNGFVKKSVTPIYHWWL